MESGRLLFYHVRMRYGAYAALSGLFFAIPNAVGAAVLTPSAETPCVKGSVNYERSAQFSPESDELTEQAAQNLRILAIAMRRSLTPVYIYSGDGQHEDTTLSTRRSEMVRDFLVSEGIARERLVLDQIAINDLSADALRILSSIEGNCDTQRSSS